MAQVTVDFSDFSDVYMSEEKTKRLIRNLEHMLKNTGISVKEANEAMAKLSQVVGRTVLEGVFKGGFVTLDKNFNGGRSFRIDHLNLGVSMSQDEKVVVTFEERKIVSVERLVDYNLKNMAEETTKTGKPKAKKKLIPEHGFYVDDSVKAIMDIASKAFHDATNPYRGFFVSLIGDAGYGKTSMAQYFAMINKIPLLIIDCSTIAENENWFVNPMFRAGETTFDLTELSNLIMQGNCAILFDEINRMPTYISNALLPILDHRKFVSLRGKTISQNNNVAYFATANHGSAYAGTSPIDKALQRRSVGTIKVGALPTVVEMELLETRFGLNPDDAKKIVTVFTRLRDSELKQFSVNVATGTSQNVAWWVKYGLPISEAFKLSVMNDAPVESHKIILEAMRLSGV